jgi:iron complex outermembrane receptor protein
MRHPTGKTIMHLAVASACMWIAMPAYAQAVAEPEVQKAPEPDASAPLPVAAVINVTGSRIVSRGFSQPTPTTTLTALDLAKTAQPNVFNTIAELPTLQGSTGRTTSTNSTSSGIQGLSSLSLRGLTPIRTLTLLDGQRVVGANVTGVTDVSQFPQLLIKRVDVVTGGASASYGSDAVGGVVNFITDKKFTGFKANVQGGETTYGDDKNGNVQAAFGTALLDGRAHFVISGEYGREKGVPSPRFGEVGANGRTWFKNPAFIARPKSLTVDGKPEITATDHAQFYQYAKYGLITQGPLAGTGFGAGGVPYKFNYGSNGVPDGKGGVTNCFNPFCVGGDLSGTVGAGTTLGMDLSRKVLYTRGSFDLTPDHELYFTLNYGSVNAQFNPNPGAAKGDNLTIQCDNPYLPASIAAACVTNNITSFKYGTVNAIFPKDIEVNPERTQQRAVIGANGKFGLFGKEWRYDAYAEHGENTIDITVHNMSLNARYNNAIDAVKLADGSIACRNAAAVASGCKPLNIIGDNPISMDALAYVEPAIGPHQHSVQKQDVVSFNLSSDLMMLPAGPLAIATGAEFRKEQYYVTGDPYGNGVFPDSPNTADYPADPVLTSPIGNNWYAGNYHNAHGSYNVREAYLELNVPVFKSDALGEANFNVADRETKYSTSGRVRGWKVGATWQTPVDGLRLRAVTSQDVRAPNLSELFAAPVVTNNSVIYNGNAMTIQQRTIGNTNLRPEIGRNTVLGIVLAQPKWAPGFSASVDFFDIKLKNGISSLAPQEEVDLCAAGNTEICGAMNLTLPAGQNYVTVQAFNLSGIHSRGVDLEAAYRTDLRSFDLPGRLTFRALATHTGTYKTDSGIVGKIPEELAGVNLGNIAKWKGAISQSWDSDKASLTLDERFVSKGVYSNEYIECQTNCPVSTNQHRTIADNQMKGAFYVDIGATYKLAPKLVAYVKIDNVANVDPVSAPQFGQGFGINPSMYDVLGRQYRAGLRYNF